MDFAGTKYDTYFEMLGNQKISFQKFTDVVLKGFKKKFAGQCTFEDVKPFISQYFGSKFNCSDKKRRGSFSMGIRFVVQQRIVEGPENMTSPLAEQR